MTEGIENDLLFASIGTALKGLSKTQSTIFGLEIAVVTIVATIIVLVPLGLIWFYLLYDGIRKRVDFITQYLRSGRHPIGVPGISDWWNTDTSKFDEDEPGVTKKEFDELKNTVDLLTSDLKEARDTILHTIRCSPPVMGIEFASASSRFEIAKEEEKKDK